jgi:uncharacterized damage-inducible protein DinB
MKLLLEEYASYNKWANKKIIDVVMTMPQEQVMRDMGSSFPSIFKTVLHMADAESIWWQRIHLAEHVEVLIDTYSGTIEELATKWTDLSLKWEEWVKQSKEVALSHVFAYQNSRREQFKQPVYQVLVHLFNHQSYHRGQLVTMLRQLKVDKIPSTDLILFTRLGKTAR